MLGTYRGQQEEKFMFGEVLVFFRNIPRNIPGAWKIPRKVPGSWKIPQGLGKFQGIFQGLGKIHGGLENSEENSRVLE